jgi:hypothetical protein
MVTTVVTWLSPARAGADLSENDVVPPAEDGRISPDPLSGVVSSQ